MGWTPLQACAQVRQLPPGMGAGMGRYSSSGACVSKEAKPIGGVPKTPPAVLLVVPAVATAAKATTTTARAAKEVARGLRGGSVIVRDDARLVVVKAR